MYISDDQKQPGWKKHKLLRFAYLEKAKEHDPNPDEPKSLGIMNAWTPGKYPAEYNNCNHIKISKNLGVCYNRYTCTICKITYTVDSSD